MENADRTQTNDEALASLKQINPIGTAWKDAKQEEDYDKRKKEFVYAEMEKSRKYKH